MERINIDQAGRVVIPKNVRDELHLEAGDSLEVACDGNSVTLRPVRSSTPLRKERGIWVHSGSPLTVAAADKLIEQARSVKS